MVNSSVILLTRLQREDWSNGTVFYTDSSKIATGTGAGWYLNENLRFHQSTGQLATVFQTEILAISNVASWIIENGLVGKSIGICSHSQAALRALERPASTSIMVHECKEKLLSIARRNRVNLVWVPGHSGIFGNEMADELANIGSSYIMSLWTGANTSN